MNDYIGKYVKRFESGNTGSLTLDSCGYDYGLSCGSYQLTLRYGNCIKFLRKYFPNESQTLYYNENEEVIKSKTWPGRHYCSSPEEVKEVWRACYDKVGKDKFFSYEHEYIKEQYYDRAAKKIKAYIDLNKTSRAFQEVFWSYSVNAGVTGAYNGLIKVLKSIKDNFTHEELFDAIYDERYRDKGTDRYKKGYKNSEREVLRPLLLLEGIGVKKITSPDGEITDENNPIGLTPSKAGAKIYEVAEGAIPGSRISVNIRVGPSTRFDVKEIVHTGDRLEVIGINKEGWACVKNKGWISSSYIREA